MRTLLQADKMNMIAEEVERYKMDVVALQEIRWKVKGSIRKVKFTLHYSGNDRQGNRGVGFFVSKKVLRICTLRIKGTHITSHSLMYMHLQKILRMKE